MAERWRSSRVEARSVRRAGVLMDAADGLRPDCEGLLMVGARRVRRGGGCPSRLIVGDRPPGGAIQIVILTVLEGPEKGGKPKGAEHDRKRNQIDQDFHQIVSLCRRARKALSITSSDEVDIAAAAISGVTRPAIASGTASAL